MSRQMQNFKVLGQYQAEQSWTTQKGKYKGTVNLFYHPDYCRLM